MGQDQELNQGQESKDESAKKETSQDQANQQDQETTTTTDSLEKVKAELEAKFKKEIAGLNRKSAELETALKEKEREKLSETEKAKAELEDIKAERAEAERERNELRRKRIIDNALYDNDLPADLFEDRISGQTEEEIKADVMAMKGHIKGIIDTAVQRQVKELLKGNDPGRQDSDSPKKLTLEQINKLPTHEARINAMKENGYYE